MRRKSNITISNFGSCKYIIFVLTKASYNQNFSYKYTNQNQSTINDLLDLAIANELLIINNSDEYSTDINLYNHLRLPFDESVSDKIKNVKGIDSVYAFIGYIFSNDKKTRSKF